MEKYLYITHNLIILDRHILD